MAASVSSSDLLTTLSGHSLLNTHVGIAKEWVALFLYLEASAGPMVYYSVLCVCSSSDIQCTIWANAMDGLGVKRGF
jgi:hypothetical protein